MAFSDSLLEQYRVGKAAEKITEDATAGQPLSTDAIIDSFKFDRSSPTPTTVQAPQHLRQAFDPSIIEKRIQERGSTFSEFSPKTDTLSRVATGAKTVGLPFELLESGIANPIIAMQQGRFNPIDIIKESAQGFAGQRQGEFGDISSNLGAPDFVAATAGLGTAIAVPGMLFKAADKLTKVSKIADSKTAKAIQSFVTAVKGNKGALVKTNAKMQKFYDDVGFSKVDQGKFLNLLGNATNTTKKHISDIPNATLREAEDQLLDLVQKGDINSVRAAKQIVDDLVSNWNKTSTGGNLSRGQGKLVEISRDLGRLMDNTVRKSKGSRYSKNFKKARHNYSELKKSYQSIQSKMTNPKTGKPTRTGRLLDEILDPRESDLRITLDAINKFGGKGNKFAQELKSIEKGIRFRETASKVVRGAAFGAAAGLAFSKASDAFELFRSGNNESVYTGISGGGN